MTYQLAVQEIKQYRVYAVEIIKHYTSLSVTDQ